jgi:hypothetical protein
VRTPNRAGNVPGRDPRCEPRARDCENEQAMPNPTLIVEVLSRTPEDYSPPLPGI